MQAYKIVKVQDVPLATTATYSGSKYDGVIDDLLGLSGSDEGLLFPLKSPTSNAKARNREISGFRSSIDGRIKSRKIRGVTVSIRQTEKRDAVLVTLRRKQ